MARRYTFARPLRGRLWTLSANTYYYVLRLLEVAPDGRVVLKRKARRSRQFSARNDGEAEAACVCAATIHSTGATVAVGQCGGPNTIMIVGGVRGVGVGRTCNAAAARCCSARRQTQSRPSSRSRTLTRAATAAPPRPSTARPVVLCRAATTKPMRCADAMRTATTHAAACAVEPCRRLGPQPDSLLT